MLPQLAKENGLAVLTNCLWVRKIFLFQGTLVRIVDLSGKISKPYKVETIYPAAGENNNLIFDVSASDLFALQHNPGQLLFELLQKTSIPVCISGLYVLEIAKIFEAVYNSPLGNGVISEQGLEPHFPFTIPQGVVDHLIKFDICQREIIDGRNKLFFPELIKRPV